MNEGLNVNGHQFIIHLSLIPKEALNEHRGP